MREKTGNPNYTYEISCDQMCGNGHYSMKGIIEVVEQEEYDLWMAKQKAQYYTAFPEKDPEEAAKAADAGGKVKAAEAAKAPATDSTAKVATAKM
jgi:cytochrome c oxidase subunit 2